MLQLLDSTSTHSTFTKHIGTTARRHAVESFSTFDFHKTADFDTFATQPFCFRQKAFDSLASRRSCHTSLAWVRRSKRVTSWRRSGDPTQHRVVLRAQPTQISRLRKMPKMRKKTDENKENAKMRCGRFFPKFGMNIGHSDSGQNCRPPSERCSSPFSFRTSNSFYTSAKTSLPYVAP